jgi:nucleotide-binding universal stress UspA family protein
MYEHLLVALDGSDAAERVLEHAQALAVAFSSQITLLRVTVSVEMVLAEEGTIDVGVGDIPPTLDPDPVVDADVESAEGYLEGVAARLRALNLSVSVEHPGGPASQVIVERAAALGVNLILMTTHGRSGLGRALFGSTADSVLRHAPCPVLLVRIPHQNEARAMTS